MPAPARNALLALAFALVVLTGGQIYPAVLAKTSAPESTAGAFAPGASLGLDAEQLANATIAMQVSDRENAPPLARLAQMVAALGESNLKVVPNGKGSGYCGVWQAHPDNIACDDTEQQAASFLRGGLGFQAGGAIRLANSHPDMSPGTIATLVEASGEPGSFYDAHRPRAEQIIAAWTTGGGVLADAPGLDALTAEADRMVSLHQPYLWGGGHQAFDPDGRWDCSGAVSWLMHYLGLLNGAPLTSTGFMTQGEPGRGQLFTIYANPAHVFLIVEAGPRAGQAWGTANRAIGTRAPTSGGPNWHEHTTAGFVARHYEGF
jgi:hypothetical protein